MRRKRWLFVIQCGDFNDTVLATSLGVAWRRLTKGQTTGFSELARFKCLVAPRGRRPRWQYIEPASLDKAP